MKKYLIIQQSFLEKFLIGLTVVTLSGCELLNVQDKAKADLAEDQQISKVSIEKNGIDLELQSALALIDPENTLPLNLILTEMDPLVAKQRFNDKQENCTQAEDSESVNVVWIAFTSKAVDRKGKVNEGVYTSKEPKTYSSKAPLNEKSAKASKRKKKSVSESKSSEGRKFPDADSYEEDSDIDEFDEVPPKVMYNRLNLVNVDHSKDEDLDLSALFDFVALSLGPDGETEPLYGSIRLSRVAGTDNKYTVQFRLAGSNKSRKLEGSAEFYTEKNKINLCNETGSALIKVSDLPQFSLEPDRFLRFEFTPMSAEGQQLTFEADATNRTKIPKIKIGSYEVVAELVARIGEVESVSKTGFAKVEIVADTEKVIQMKLK